MNLDALHTPDEVAAGETILAAVDDALASGMARLSGTQRDALAGLGRVFGGTPLGERVAGAVDAIGSGHVTDDALLVLAAARASLQGARHDALVAAANEALGGLWAMREADAQAAEAPSKEATALLDGSRQWLTELALAGFGQIERAIVTPFYAALEELQQRPALVRVATLLTGFADELLESVPTAAMEQLPLRRWCDLWARAMLATTTPPAAAATEQVSGELRVLGADLRHHDHMASLVAYGIFDGGIVRTTLSHWKVDAVGNEEMWSLFDGVAPALVTALAERKTLSVSDMQLAATGDLLWTGSAKLGKSFDPIADAEALLAAGARVAIPTLLPGDRHPVQIALPLVCGSQATTAATDRISAATGMRSVPSAPCFALLRYDAGSWQLQPLAAAGKGKRAPGPTAAIGTARKIRKSASTIAILQERASKLLRA